MLTRRRFIEIAAVAGAAAMTPGQVLSAIPTKTWTGVAMGARTSITLAHPDKAEADRIIGKARDEIEWLETVFSLYRPDSALSTLNRQGHLDLPPFEMISLLALARGVNAATGGVFDPTIQPVWQAAAEHFAKSEADLDDATLAAAQARTGWAHVRFDETQVRFAHAGMAMTLNGIAQGYATDRVAELLRAEGLSDVLVNVGEIRALGDHPAGRPWAVGLAEHGDEHPEEEITISNIALATSAPLGTVLDTAGRTPHTIDPRTGEPGGTWRRVSVLGPTAAIADGLSTAFSMMSGDEIRASLAHYPGYRAIAVNGPSERLDVTG